MSAAPVELSLNGVYYPPWLLAALLGLVLAMALAELANRIGLSRFVWASAAVLHRLGRCLHRPGGRDPGAVVFRLIHRVALGRCFLRAGRGHRAGACGGKGGHGSRGRDRLDDRADALAQVEPMFEWIRLAQRIPVRIRLDAPPEGIVLRAGLTASVAVIPSAAIGDAPNPVLESD